MELKKKCPICGKEWEILNADEWVFKIKTGHKTEYFCRYNCMRAWQTAHEKPSVPMKHTEVEGRKAPRKPMADSRELIEKLLEIIKEDGSKAAVEHLEQLGYDHWKKWWQLKDWARKHAPDLREQMPDKLTDRRVKEEKAEEQPAEPGEDPKKWDKWITPERELKLQELTESSEPPKEEKGGNLLGKYLQNRDKQKPAEDKGWEKYQPEQEAAPAVKEEPLPLEVVALETEMGRFLKTNDKTQVIWEHGPQDIKSYLGEHVMLPPEDWRAVADLIPRVLNVLEGGVKA